MSDRSLTTQSVVTRPFDVNMRDRLYVLRYIHKGTCIMSPLWQRRHILALPSLLKPLRDFMSAVDYLVYVNMWADAIESTNPEFKRDRFVASCHDA